MIFNKIFHEYSLFISFILISQHGTRKKLTKVNRIHNSELGGNKSVIFTMEFGTQNLGDNKLVHSDFPTRNSGEVNRVNGAQNSDAFGFQFPNFEFYTI